LGEANALGIKGWAEMIPAKLAGEDPAASVLDQWEAWGLADQSLLAAHPPIISGLDAQARDRQSDMA
jgi:hypothetical protein